MSDYEVEVLVRGRPVKVFKHKGDRFIEGRHGSSFELKITNNTWNRIEVVTSVDGLSVVNGEECGTDSEGYLVPAKNFIIIPGWKLPNDKAAEFVFEDKRKSYSNQVGKGTQNVGVIGFMVFTEKVKITSTPNSPYIPTPLPYPYPPIRPEPWSPGPWNPWHPSPWYIYPDISWQETPTWAANTTGNSPLRGSTQKTTGVGSLISESLDGISISNTCDSVSLSSSSFGATLGSDGLNSVNVVAQSAQPEFEIGTGWGDEIDHKVSEVKFERIDRLNPDKILSIYYDTIRGLENRGIQVKTTKKKKTSNLPNAFPTYKNSGCAPPPGWSNKK